MTLDLFAPREKPAHQVSDEHARAFEDARERTIAERFEQFHRENPAVYRELVRLARQARAAGCEKIGIRMAWERLRWHFAVEARGNTADDFKLNDHYTSRFARLIMEREADLAGIFETREIRTP